MDYQLVIKFWRKSLDDEAFLATLEAELSQVLGTTAALDGHDVSAKEINLFMFTDDPRSVFGGPRTCWTGLECCTASPQPTGWSAARSSLRCGRCAWPGNSPCRERASAPSQGA